MANGEINAIAPDEFTLCLLSNMPISMEDAALSSNGYNSTESGSIELPIPAGNVERSILPHTNSPHILYPPNVTSELNLSQPTISEIPSNQNGAGVLDIYNVDDMSTNGDDSILHVLDGREVTNYFTLVQHNGNYDNSSAATAPLLLATSSDYVRDAPPEIAAGSKKSKLQMDHVQ